jgi:eukaryotic-like serine/threonine-protein kinase
VDDRFAELLEQRHDRLRSGQISVDVDAELEAEVKQQLEEAEECLRLIERVRRAHGHVPNVSEQPADASLGTTRSDRLKIGRFEILEELGRGAHGIVFLARDPAARRRVALKTPHPDVLFTPELRSRFLREGIAAARLAHTNIISVLEVDQSGPVCYIVSSFCEGKSLAAFLAEHAESLSPEVGAQWTAELADAVEHAHRHGILHRDLKPGNVILEPAAVRLAKDEHPVRASHKTEGSALIPKLTDFGLAKLVDSQDMRSRTGVLLGTPAYMAPEQVDGGWGKIGPTTDVYGLGAVLYELLTHKPPFIADSQVDLLRQIASGDPRAPGVWRRDLPRDLEAICLRCLQRRPRDRYASAAALAADLRRFLLGEVTRARPLGIAGRLSKWARRQPASATTLAVAVLAALLMAVGASWHFVQMERALGVAEEARAHAVQRGEELQQMVYVRDLQGAHQALAQQNVRNASYLLDRNQPSAGTRGGFLWRYLWARCHGQPRRLAAHRGHAHSVDFSPDGRSLVSAGSDGAVSICEVASGRRSTIRWGAREVNFACYSPDGRILATAESGGKVRLWNVAQRSTLFVWESSALQQVNCLAWTADGRQLAAAGFPGESSVAWDVANGQSRVLPLGNTDEVNSLAYSPDGKLLATASSDETVCLWDCERGCQRARLEPNQTHVTCVRFSPDGQLLATSGVVGAVKIWNVADGSLAATLETNSERVDALAFSPRDPVLAIGDHFGTVREWDWKLNRVVRALDSRQGRILSLAYSPASKMLASAAREGSLCVWDLAQETSYEECPSYRCGCAVAFDAGNSSLVYGRAGGGLSVFSPRDLSMRVLETGSPDSFLSLAAAGSRVFLTRDQYCDVYSGDTLGKTPFAPIATFERPIDTMLVTPDGRLLLTADHLPPHRVQLWDAVTGRHFGVVGQHQTIIRSLACTPSGDLAASGSGDGQICVWDLKARTLVNRIEGHRSTVRSLSFSADGRMLASGGDDRQVRFWHAATGKAIDSLLHHPARVGSVVFCPDEPLVATGDDQGFVRIWSASSGEEVLVLGQLPAGVGYMTFSPDGSWLAAGTDVSSYDHPELRIWRAPALDHLDATEQAP